MKKEELKTSELLLIVTSLRQLENKKRREGKEEEEEEIHQIMLKIQRIIEYKELQDNKQIKTIMELEEEEIKTCDYCNHEMLADDGAFCSED